MIIVRLKGGLGNQLFQYAFAKALRDRLKAVIRFDVSWFKERRKYEFDLSLRNFKVRLPTVPCNIAGHPHQYARLRRLFGRRLSRLLLPVPITDKDFSESALREHKHIYFDGYWQDYRLFDDVRAEILEDIVPRAPLSPENEPYVRELDEGQSVAVHFRGGPYLQDPLIRRQYAELSGSYLARAMELIERKTGGARFYVFSNDIPEAQRAFAGTDRVRLIRSAGPDFEHLYLMSRCQHCIISNSTFSWWGAWLNSHPNRIVVAPREWLSEEFKRDPRNVHFTGMHMPGDWIRISN